MAKFNVTLTVEVNEEDYSLEEGEAFIDYFKNDAELVLKDADSTFTNITIEPAKE